MLMLVFINDLGSSLMFFGAFLALLYVATGRFSYVLIGLVIFAIGAYAIGSSIPHVHDRFEIWLDPFATGKDVPDGAGPGPAVAVRAGRRRALRPGPRRVAAEAPRSRSRPTASSRSPTAAASCRPRTPTSSSPS